MYGNRYLGIAEGVPMEDIGNKYSDDILPSFAWPGGYALAYVDDDGSVLCADCANRTVRQNAAAIEDDWQETDRADVANLYRAHDLPSGQDRIVAAFTTEGDDEENPTTCDDCSRVIG